MSIALRSALFLSMHELAEAQTAAYGSGWTSSAPKLAELCRVLSIDLAASIVVNDGRIPVGIALVGTRADRGWLHDIAVAPNYRRMGLGRRMMEAVLQAMREAGMREVELDVAGMRRDAIGLYSKLGFEARRSYLNLAAPAVDLGLDRAKPRPGYQIVSGTIAQLIEAYATTLQNEPEPCWDRSLASLVAYPDGYISRLLDGEHELGLMHYLARPAQGGDPDRIRPLFVRLAPEAGAAEFAILLAETGRAAFGDHRRLTIRVALEPRESRFASLLKDLKMPVVAESFDMRLAL
jgi:ribosomal protein S18 acetylase RimI-like enzyme